MYEGGLKVAACAFWPQQIRQGATNNQVYLTMDIFPTVLDAAGVVFPKKGLDGISFFPLLINKKDSITERTVFFCRREGDAEYGGKTIDAIRQGDWKLLQNTPFSPRELYNLKEDPLEQKNLITTQKEKFRELNALQRVHLQRSGAVPWQIK
jgi:arylsulfatase A-like enzyme